MGGGTARAFIVYFTLRAVSSSWSDSRAPDLQELGLTVLTITWIALALILVGLVYLVTRLELWGQVWTGIGDLGALGLALWGLVVTAALMGVSFLAFRRAIP